MKNIRLILLPFSWLFALVVALRNFCFRIGIIKQKEVTVPNIVIGNLSVGGTGKTPHTEYLIRFFKEQYQLAVLSRGYGRKTTGYLVGKTDHRSEEIGDEPRQIKNKFPQVPVVVCENRLHGLDMLQQDFPKTELVLLDDAFQHRRLKPGYSILLSDYYQLYTNDYLLPAGNLREFRSGARRADVIIVTKTPVVLSPIIQRFLIAKIKPLPHQKVLFSFIRYGKMIPFYANQQKRNDKPSVALVFAGIANIYPFEDHVKRLISRVSVMKFSDHHEYTFKDIEKIKKEFNRLLTKSKIIVTTEKDYMRLMKPEFKAVLADLPLYYLSIEIGFHGDDDKKLKDAIVGYVEKNKRNH